MRFTLLLLVAPEGPAATASVPGRADARARRYDADLQRAGVLLARDVLLPPSAGARVTFRCGRPSVADGSRAASPRAASTGGEVVGGYWVIDVASRAEALQWAARCPAGDDEVVEVRPVRDLAAAEVPEA